MAAKVTIEDLETGEVEVQMLPVDNYVVICSPKREISHIQVYPTTGTHVVTIKRCS